MGITVLCADDSKHVLAVLVRLISVGQFQEMVEILSQVKLFIAQPLQVLDTVH